MSADHEVSHLSPSSGSPMPASRFSGRRRWVAGAAAAATGLAVLSPALGAGTSAASSHREAPYTASDPRVDNTDVYAFVSPDDPDTVTFVANWIPFEEPNGGPNFYPFGDDVAYDIEIDNDGDAVVDLVYRWVFVSSYRNPDTFLYNTGQVTSLDDTDLNFQQTYDLQLKQGDGAFVTIADDQPVAPSNVGPASMPDYASLRDEAVVDVTGGLKSFAGQADDPFFLDLRVFDLLYGAPKLDQVGVDTLNGYNVNTIALQVPKNLVAAAGSATANPVIGVFSTTSRRSTRVLETDGTVTESGEYAQVSRLGSPLVNEVVVPVGLKDAFNNSRPEGDGDFLPLVQDPEVPRLIEALYGIEAPPTPRNDLVQVFLTGVDGLTNPALNAVTETGTPSEMLRLNLSVPPADDPDRLGVVGGDTAGFPNGRRLTDDVVDIGLQALEGVLLGGEQAALAATLGDGVSSNDLSFGSSFPYVALPHNSSVNQSQFAGFDRLAGDDRYATAAAIARDGFPSAGTAIVVNGDEAAFADALAANYLAGNAAAPVLLTQRDTTPSTTLAALRDLGVEQVVIVGGPARVSTAQQDALDREFAVTRVAGADRYATARAVAERPGAGNVEQGTAILATGASFADALVAGPVSYGAQFPILLTESGRLSTDAKAALEALDITRVIIPGGPRAVSAEVESAVRALDLDVVRLAGTDRQGTAVAVADFATAELGFSRTHANLARGDVAADSLSGGPHAGLERSVILLTQSPTVLGSATRDYLVRESSTLESGHVFGGPSAVSAALMAAATDAGNPDS